MKNILRVLSVLNEGFDIGGDSSVHSFEQLSGETNQSGVYRIMATIVASDADDVYLDLNGKITVEVDFVSGEPPSFDSWGAPEETHVKIADHSSVKWDIPNEETKEYIRNQIRIHGEDKFYSMIYDILRDMVAAKLAA